MLENTILASKHEVPEVTIITEGFSLFGLAYGIMSVQNCYLQLYNLLNHPAVMIVIELSLPGCSF
jgi:hypothetical protein